MIAQEQGHYGDEIRDTFINKSANATFVAPTIRNSDPVTAGSRLCAEKVLPGQVRITDCVVTA